MGEVYRATDSVLERTVAVKLLSDHYASQQDARARFRREALAAARLSAAPNVVTVFDVAEHRGRPLIVMEYLEGGSVYERMRQGRIPHETALCWLEQVGVAIDRAHENGVVHRDVKPANLLLDDEGNVHVSDFGIASTSGADALTAPGTVLGTAGYLAPEQARGEPATAASDRYALGVVAFELLTGRRPFAGDTPTTEALAHLNADVPRATALDPTLPAAVDDVFRSALAKDPHARPASAQRLVRRLREALETEDTASATTVVDAGAATRTLVYRSRRPRGALIALGTTCLLVAGFLVAALTGAGDEFGHRDASQGGAASSAGASGARRSDASSTTAAAPDGAALNAHGFALVQAGNFDSALPILRRAVLTLKGDGTLTEAYASYNLAYARFAVGRCDGVTGLLDRSEGIQGSRAEIDDLRHRWQSRCAPGGEVGDEGDDGKPGKGHGRGKGQDG
jgi:eukaryotic-like serine/threonine-protein kinase